MVGLRHRGKKLIEYLRQEGSTQIPTDHNRIFDTLQEHGYILPTASGMAIWHTVVTGPEGAFRFELTMLKFEIARLLPPTRRPAAFNGTIEVIERTDNGATGRPPLTTEAAPASPFLLQLHQQPREHLYQNNRRRRQNLRQIPSTACQTGCRTTPRIA